MAKFVCEDVVEFEKEDSGQALTATLVPDDGQATGLFVRLQSWDAATEHADAKTFAGKRVRVTVETID